MTIDDLRAMPDDGNRYEIIEGELFVSPAPDLIHQIVSDNIAHLIRNYLERHPVGFVLPSAGLIFTEYTGVVPDIAFFSFAKSNQIVSGERLTRPALVIEILSAGTENVRAAKRQLYGKHGVLEYWLIDRDAPAVELYRLHGESLESAGVFQGEDELSTPELPGFSCAASHIFRLPPL